MFPSSPVPCAASPELAGPESKLVLPQRPAELQGTLVQLNWYFSGVTQTLPARLSFSGPDLNQEIFVFGSVAS